MTRWLLLPLLAVATNARFFGGPTVDGDSYRYDGKGTTYDPTDAFEEGDAFNSIMLTNWDMSEVANLSIPRSVQTLTLFKCELRAVPAEINDLSLLTSLNMASNEITTVDEGFAADTKLTLLNLTHNQLAAFNAVIPTLEVLDLSSNALIDVSATLFQMPRLSSLYMQGNLAKIATLTVAQFDFFAGLTDFKADFVDVSACANGSDLVTLKGSRVCRVSNDVEPIVIIVPASTPPSTESSSSPTVPTAAPVSVAPASVNEPTHTNKNKTFIASGVVFVLLAIGCVGGLYTALQRRQTALLRGALHEETPLFFDSDTRAKYYNQELAAGDKLFPSNDPVLVTWRIDYDTVKLVKRLAKGAYGEVWIGRYRGAKVAVKKLREDSEPSYEASEDFIREIKLMAWLRHPKIIEFIGVAWTRLVDMVAVTEFMDSGDLRSYLDTHRRGLAWPAKLPYALDTIDALVYLHSSSPVIIHRDLKSRNILVDAKKGAKLADFGISAAKRTDRDMTVGIGTTRWLAPELARGDANYTEAVDVYAFGVILAELDTHALPFQDAVGANGERLTDLAILQGVATGKLSVRLSPECPEGVRLLVMRCTAFEPSDRPSAAEVAYEVRRKDLLLGGSTGGFV